MYFKRFVVVLFCMLQSTVFGSSKNDDLWMHRMYAQHIGSGVQKELSALGDPSWHCYQNSEPFARCNEGRVLTIRGWVALHCGWRQQHNEPCAVCKTNQYFAALKNIGIAKNNHGETMFDERCFVFPQNNICEAITERAHKCQKEPTEKQKLGVFTLANFLDKLDYCYKQNAITQWKKFRTIERRALALFTSFNFLEKREHQYKEDAFALWQKFNASKMVNGKKKSCPPGFENKLAQKIQEEPIDNTVQQLLTQADQDFKRMSEKGSGIARKKNTVSTVNIFPQIAAIMQQRESKKVQEKLRLKPSQKEWWQMTVKDDLDELAEFVKKATEVQKTNRFLQAASCGDLHIVKFLVENGVSVNVCDKNGKTVLHRASNKEGVVRYLLSHDADKNAIDCDGNTPLDIALITPNSNCVIALLKTPKQVHSELL